MIYPLFMSAEGLEKLGEIALDITPEKMEVLLSKPLPAMLSEKKLEGEQLYGLLRLFRFSADDEDFNYVMSKLIPDWKADRDYGAVAQARNKDWYTQKKVLQPLRVRDMHPEILRDILPYFGDRGAQILIQLCENPELRRYLVLALMEIPHRRGEARERLSKVQSIGEEDRFLVGLALWCLGDDSQRKKYENYLRFEPGHAKANTVRKAMAHMTFDTVYSLFRQIRNGKPDKHFPIWAGEALSHYKNKKSAEFIMSLWNDETTSRRNPEYGELFNCMAGQNFGMDRAKIKKWIEALPRD